MLDVKFVSKLVIVNVLLLTLLSFGTAMSIVNPEQILASKPKLNSDLTKEPHKLLNQAKVKTQVTGNNVIKVTCKQLMQGSIAISQPIDSGQVRIVTPNCMNASPASTLTRVLNKTNNFNATIFNINKDSISTDYIFLEEGINVVEFQQTSRSKSLMAKLIINKK